MIRGARTTFHWHLVTVAEALRIQESCARDYFQDGRMIGSLIEYRLAQDLGAKPVPVDGGGIVLRDDEGDWRVRMLTDHVTFAPQSMFGTGRSFSAHEFESFLTKHAGFVIADAKAFPDVPVVAVPSDIVQRLLARGHIRGGKLNRDTALSAFFLAKLF